MPSTPSFFFARSKLLARFPDADGRNTYKYDDSHDFHLYSTGGLFFLCLSEHGVQLRVAYGLLTALHEKFVSNYDGRWQRANAYAMSDFAHVISGELKRFNDPESDKMHRLKHDIADVKDVMRNNITKVLERGEQIDLLVAELKPKSVERVGEFGPREEPGAIPVAVEEHLPHHGRVELSG